MPFQRLHEDIREHLGVGCYQYVFDAQLYPAFSAQAMDAVEILICYVQSMMCLMGANKLKLHPEKIEVLLVWNCLMWLYFPLKKVRSAVWGYS